MGTTNYVETFIRVAEDCPATIGTMPPSGAWPTVARLQYDLLAEHPYELTSDDVLFRVHATRAGIPEEEQAQARAEFFSKSQACLRSSPWGKRSGWGRHHDADGRVALVAVESERYRELSEDGQVKQLRAMRSKRA